MTRAGLTEKLLDIKREKGWTWKYICEQIGGMSPVMIIGGVLGRGCEIIRSHEERAGLAQ